MADPGFRRGGRARKVLTTPLFYLSTPTQNVFNNSIRRFIKLSIRSRRSQFGRLHYLRFLPAAAWKESFVWGENVRSCQQCHRNPKVRLCVCTKAKEHLVSTKAWDVAK